MAIRNPKVGDLVWHTLGPFMGGHYPASYRLTDVTWSLDCVAGTLVEYVPEPRTTRYLDRASGPTTTYLPKKDIYRTKEAAWKRYLRNLQKESDRISERSLQAWNIIDPQPFDKPLRFRTHSSTRSEAPSPISPRATRRGTPSTA